MKNRLDGSTQQIYDCLLRGDERCVTVSDGIATDATATVHLLFASTLSGGKPACAY